MLLAVVLGAVAALMVLQRILGLVVTRPRLLRPFVVEANKTFENELAKSSRQWTKYTLVLTGVATIGAVLSLTAVAISPRDAETLAVLASWIAALGLLTVRIPRKAPMSILTIVFAQTITQIIMLGEKSTYLDSDIVEGLIIASLVASFLSILTILLMPLRDPYLSSEDISKPMTEPTSSLRSPEDNLALYQFLTVSWMTPLIRVGFGRQLQDEDVWQLSYEFQHRHLHDNFKLLRGTVIQRLIRANAIDLLILTLLTLEEVAVQYSLPLILQRILAAMEDVNAPRTGAIFWSAIALAVRAVGTQSGVLSMWYGRRCYERSRGEMITMLYAKTLARKVSFAPDEKIEKDASNGNANGKLNGGTAQSKETNAWHQRPWQEIASFFRRTKLQPPPKQPASMGKILNLMRNDVYEVAQRFWEIQGLIQKPLTAILSVVLVVKLLGTSSLLAVLALALAQMGNFLLARIMVHFERKRRVVTDGKLQVISQFVEAIRHLRYYGWQHAWLTQIMAARQKELRLRIITQLWSLGMSLMNSLAIEMTPVVAFGAYTVIADRSLTVDVAFPAMQIFQMMSSTFRDLPQLVIVVINALVAVGRIEDFMAEADRQEMSTEALFEDEMRLEAASFAWPGSQEPVLRDINISFPKGLTLVYGEVGAGKTALLQALLGELDKLSGLLLRPNEPIGYCAQTPWLQSMSIRENILFGVLNMDKERYDEVIDICCLAPDLGEFGAGDLTMIGENGVGLSGGQRARVALARALYHNNKILLLDDPISALDQQTAEAMVKKLFKSWIAKDTTIVLVTHRIDLVTTSIQQIVEVLNGTAMVRSVSHEDPSGNGVPTLSPTVSKTDQRKMDQEEDEPVPDKFIEDEHRAHGGVRASVYWEYIKAGQLQYWAILVVLLTIYRTLAVVQAWFLKSWGEAYNTRSSVGLLIQSEHVLTTKPTDILDGYPSPEDNIKPWLVGFAVLAIGQSIAQVISQGFMIVIVYTAGKNMFADIMRKVAGATFRFYDVTPIGRLMNRMTSDISVIDGNISMQFQMVAFFGISWISSAVVIAAVTPTFLAFVALLTIAFVLIFRRFIPTSQSLRRLEMVSLTPLMSNFGALLNGLTTVRAFHAQDQFQARVIRVVDTFQKMDHYYWSLQAWLMYRYDALSSVATFIVTMLAIYTNTSAGLTAFVLLAANRLVLCTHYLCKQYGQLQMEFVSVERVVELIHLEQEPPGAISPPAWWPSFGSDITFNGVTIKYAPHLDPALSGISFTVKGGSKTAIIGRTGSGKSTLALTMLATMSPETGSIIVDNVDLAEVDKQLLRTRVTFLAQDPVLFPGTMRQNLDPVKEHTDEECDAVLQRVCERQGWSLDTKVEAGGRNLSQGQRQLVGLTRAVLRRSAIIILDEATASIDRESAMQIQQVMHEEMKESTVITIAHRLEAVRNADYCVVLGKGKILDQGPASEMLQRHRDDMVDE